MSILNNVEGLVLKAGKEDINFEMAKAAKEEFNGKLFNVYNVFRSVGYTIETGKHNGWWSDSMVNKYVVKAAKEGIRQNAVVYQQGNVSARDFYRANKVLVALAGVKWDCFKNKSTVFYGI